MAFLCDQDRSQKQKTHQNIENSILQQMIIKLERYDSLKMVFGSIFLKKGIKICKNALLFSVSI